MKISATAWMSLAVGLLTLAAWWWAVVRVSPPPTGALAVAPSPAQRAQPVPSPVTLLAPATPLERTSLRSPQQFARWLADDSSLRGVVLDGGWDIDASGHLHATLALRRRFDQLLTLAGEAKVDEITGYIEQQVRDAHGAAAVGEVLDTWQRYLALQRHVYTSQPDPKDRNSLQAALAERQLVRRTVLGPVLAAAFFGEEEAVAQAQWMGGQPAAPVQSMQIDRASLDPAALVRVQQADAEWADWQRRLEAARADVARLQAAPELSDLQRREAIDRLIAERFNASEAVRARALLHVPAPHA